MVALLLFYRAFRAQAAIRPSCAVVTALPLQMTRQPKLRGHGSLEMLGHQTAAQAAVRW